MEREVVCESEGICLYAGVDGIKEVETVYLEATKAGKAPPGCLRVKLPVGYADKTTANGNFYESSELKNAFGVAEALMNSGGVHGAHGEHPKGRADLRPDEISHLVTKCWLGDEKITVAGEEVVPIWNEWLIIPTRKGGGDDLIKLFKAGASIGTSIRGTAVRESGKFMRHYTYKGTDTVGVPSTGFRPGVNNENLRATIWVEELSNISEEIKGALDMGDENDNTNDADAVKLNMESISESLKNVGDGKANAGDLISLGTKIGAIQGQLTALQGTAAAKDRVIEGLKTEVAEAESLRTALAGEKDSATTESTAFKESVEKLNTQLSAVEANLKKRTEELTQTTVALEELRSVSPSTEPDKDSENYTEQLEAAVEEGRAYALFLEGVTEEVRDYALRAEQVILALKDRLTRASGEGVAESSELGDKALAVIESLVSKVKEAQESAVTAAAAPKGQSPALAAYSRSMQGKYASLKHFSEELKIPTTMAKLTERIGKYLDLLDRNGKVKFESIQHKNERPAGIGIERHLGGMR